MREIPCLLRKTEPVKAPFRPFKWQTRVISEKVFLSNKIKVGFSAVNCNSKCPPEFATYASTSDEKNIKKY